MTAKATLGPSRVEVSSALSHGDCGHHLLSFRSFRSTSPSSIFSELSSIVGVGGVAPRWLQGAGQVGPVADGRPVRVSGLGGSPAADGDPERLSWQRQEEWLTHK